MIVWVKSRAENIYICLYIYISNVDKNKDENIHNEYEKYFCNFRLWWMCYSRICRQLNVTLKKDSYTSYKT